VSAGYGPGTIRIWDGTAWRLSSTEWAELPYEFIIKGGGSSLISTTTTVTKSATTVHSGAAVTITGNTTGRNGGNLEFYYRVGSGAWALIASRAAPTGGGDVTVTHTPTAGGTNYYVRFTGSTTHLPSDSAATTSVTVQTYKTATANFYVGWTQAYNGSGAKIVGTGHDGAVHQGYYSSTFGNRKSLLAFSPNFPAGAVVSQVIFDCNAGWAYWTDKDGGVAVVGYFRNQTAKPTSWNTVDTVENRTRKQLTYSSYFEVDITSWAASVVTSPTFSGITLGPGPSTNPGYYGYSVDAPAGNFILRCTYSYWS
jgi:hypothetical protein